MRKAKPKKRVILPDPVFNDVRVTKFVNHLMFDGKKNTAFTIFYDALETVKSKLPNEEMTALEIWKRRSKMLLRKWRLNRAVWVVQHSRFRPKSVRTARSLYQ